MTLKNTHSAVAVGSMPWLESECTTAEASSGHVASQRSGGCDESTLTPYYQDSAITLYHGDCRKVMQQMESASVGLVLTDPPYGVAFRYAGKYDDADVRGYCGLMADSLDEMRRIGKIVMLTPGVVNVAMYPPANWMLCWAKPGSPRRNATGGFNEWEPVLMYGRRKIQNDFLWLAAWNNTTRDGGKEHPCPKPIKLLTWLVEQGCDAGETVLDPFAGSGTTLRAAKDMGRKAIGIEVEERYCEIIAKRMSQEVLNLTPAVEDATPTVAARARGSRNTTAQDSNQQLCENTICGIQ